MSTGGARVEQGLRGVSRVGEAVATLGNSLDRASEAALHATEGLTHTTDAFGFYRQAFGDARVAALESISQSAGQAINLVREAISALESAKDATRQFVAQVAPGLPLTDSGKTRESPSGGELLDTVARPRNLKDVSREFVREGQDVADLVHDGHDISNGVIGLFDRPDPTGIVNVAQVPRPVVTPGPPPGSPGGTGPGSGDVVLTAILGLAIMVKAAQSTGSYVWKMINGDSDDESGRSGTHGIPGKSDD